MRHKLNSCRNLQNIYYFDALKTIENFFKPQIFLSVYFKVYQKNVDLLKALLLCQVFVVLPRYCKKKVFKKPSYFKYE